MIVFWASATLLCLMTVAGSSAGPSWSHGGVAGFSVGVFAGKPDSFAGQGQHAGGFLSNQL